MTQNFQKNPISNQFQNPRQNQFQNVQPPQSLQSQFNTPPKTSSNIPDEVNNIIKREKRITIFGFIALILILILIAIYLYSRFALYCQLNFFSIFSGMICPYVNLFDPKYYLLIALIFFAHFTFYFNIFLVIFISLILIYRKWFAYYRFNWAFVIIGIIIIMLTLNPLSLMLFLTRNIYMLIPIIPICIGLLMIWVGFKRSFYYKPQQQPAQLKKPIAAQAIQPLNVVQEPQQIYTFFYLYTGLFIICAIGASFVPAGTAGKDSSGLGTLPFAFLFYGLILISIFFFRKYKPVLSYTKFLIRIFYISLGIASFSSLSMAGACDQCWFLLIPFLFTFFGFIFVLLGSFAIQEENKWVMISYFWGISIILIFLMPFIK